MDVTVAIGFIILLCLSCSLVTASESVVVIGEAAKFASGPPGATEIPPFLINPDPRTQNNLIHPPIPALGTSPYEIEYTSGNEPYVFVTKWGSYGSGDGQFYGPYRVAVDSSGNVYVADTWNYRIQKFTSAGAFITKWGTHGYGDGQFDQPIDVAVDSSGNVYVADLLNYRIQKFSSSGAFLAKWGNYGSDDGEFYNPSGIAVDSSGNVYVADTWNHRIQKFGSDGTFLAKWGNYGSDDGQFSNPYLVAVDLSGNVYVMDTGNNRIQKFTSAGAFITKWGTHGYGDGQFDLPYGVAVDSSGNVYVADTYNNRIQKFTSAGAFITKWGSYGSGNGQLYYPTGVAVDSSNNVYVSDMRNNRIQKFATSSGNPPVANFMGTPTSGTAPLTVTFTDSSTNTPTSWSWNFGDGDTTNSTKQNPVHKYASAGTYTVALTATNSAGSNLFTRTGYIIVSSTPSPTPSPRVNAFNVTPRSGQPLTQFTITYTVSDTGGSGLKQVELWETNNEDSNGNPVWSTFSHTKSVSGSGPLSGSFSDTPPSIVIGSYWYGVHVVDNAGNWNDEKNSQSGGSPGVFGPIKVMITTSPVAPVANFEGKPTSGTAPLTVQFTDLSTNMLTYSSSQNQQESRSGFITKTIPVQGTSNGETIKDSIPITDNAEISIITDSATGNQYAAGEVIVRYNYEKIKSTTLMNEYSTRINAKIGAVVIQDLSSPNLPGMQLVQIPNSISVTDAIAEYEKSPDVLYAEPNYIYYIDSLTPNDPYYSSLQWGLNNHGQTIEGSVGSVGADINASEAWDLTTGSYTVVVAVVDSGADYLHPDLSANMWSNSNEIPDNGIDDDRNGYIDDVRGWNFYSKNNNPMDGNTKNEIYHGTHCSGIIGAVGNNGVGISGVNWNVKIIPLRISNAAGDSRTSDGILAIKYASANGASVISNSWGGSSYSQALKDVIDNSPAVIVCAAGNKGTNNENKHNYPSDYTSANIISVAATDNKDNLAWFSNYGITSVDLAAPGVNIYSTKKDSAYQNMSGTSMATPFVSGVAALVKAKNQSLTNIQIRSAILNNVDAKSSLSGKVVTGGRLNAYKAISSTTPSSTSWSWNFGDGSTSTSQNPSHTYNSAGIYTVKLTATNSAGSNTLTQTNFITVTKDVTPPTITITSPTANQKFTTATVTVKGTASDNVGLSKVEVKVGSGPWQIATGTSSWSKSVTLASGSNKITARATDTSGNFKDASVTVTYNK